MTDELSPENATLHDRIWREEIAAGRLNYWAALNRLLDAARAEGPAISSGGTGGEGEGSP